MSIINEMIKGSKLNPNEKRRWKKEETIPCVVLYTLWKSGINLEGDPPETGIGLMRFLELLRDFIDSCTDNETCADASNLYENTVKFELMPNWKNKKRPKKDKLKWPHRKD